jgi:PAS domain S-box-containing protein
LKRDSEVHLLYQLALGIEIRNDLAPFLADTLRNWMRTLHSRAGAAYSGRAESGYREIIVYPAEYRDQPEHMRLQAIILASLHECPLGPEEWVRSFPVDTNLQDARLQVPCIKETCLVMALPGFGFLTLVLGVDTLSAQAVAAMGHLLNKLAQACLYCESHQALFELNDISDNIPILIAHFSKDQRYLYINAAHERFSWVKKNDVIGRHVREIIGEDGYCRARPHIDLVLRGEAVAFENQIPNGAGELRNTYVQYTPQWDETGQVVGYYTLIQDITERKQMEEALLQSNETARAILNAATETVLLVDRSDTIIAANETAAARLGVRGPSDLNGRNSFDVLPPQLAASRKEQFGQALQLRKPVCFEDEREGEWFESTIYPIIEPDGEIRRFAVYGRDITERKVFERSLQQSEARLLEAQRVSHTGSWELDLKTYTMWASEEAHRIYGIVPSADKTMPLAVAQNVIEREYRQPLDQAMNDMQASGGAIPYNVEFYIRKVDSGERRAIQSRADLVLDAQGKPSRVTGTIQDITEWKQVEEEIRSLNSGLEQRVRERTAQLEAANQELEAFAYSVSHDLRSPLRSVMGFAQVLQETYSGQLDETGVNYLNRIVAAAQRMGLLIDSLLKLSRVTRSPLHFEEIDLSPLAQELIADLRGADPERQVEVILPDHLTVRADGVLMRIVLDNLLRNAWKFTAKTPGARIELGSIQQDGKVVYFVRDNGAGFDMAYAGKLFSPFQRLHSEKEFEGTGIGLTMVQRILHRHGGRIWAEGAVGLGSTFYFTVG